MFRKKKTKKPTWNFPRDLTELGYFVNEKTELRKIEGTNKDKMVSFSFLYATLKNIKCSRHR